MTPTHDGTSQWTPNREAVFQALVDAHGSVSAQRLHFTMHVNGHDIGLATVYRSLHALVASGHAELIHSANGTQLFCTAAEGQTHRLVCRDCQRRVPITVTFADEWAAAVANDHSFADSHLVLEIAGHCGTCPSPPPTEAHPMATNNTC
ncbi:Fur family transcriptional regulator [Saccharopolyspora shandongensis]|uniref:Fur family transcriptional regulator n=1 Tax=Saccharopolyspora shandongensis TaxID=418495 RepID=UPI00342DDF90